MACVSALRRSPRFDCVVRVPDHQRDVRDLLVVGHAVLRPPVVLGQQEAVVGGEHQRRVAPQVVGVEVGEQATEVVVAHGDDGGIIGADLGDLLLRLRHALVDRPVQHLAVPAGLVGLLEALGRVERLVRIEGLDLQEPVVGALVHVEELEALGEALHGRELALLADELAVHDVAQLLPGVVRRGAPRERLSSSASIRSSR